MTDPLLPPDKLDVNDRAAFRPYHAELERNRKRLVVLLDGGRQDHVLSYDQSAGVIVRHKMWEGRAVIIEGEIAIETVTGKVEVYLEDQ